MTPEKRAELQARGYLASDDIGDILGMTEADRPAAWHGAAQADQGTTS